MQAIVGAVRSLVLSLSDQRKAALADNLTQTTSADIDCLIAATRSRGLAASTIAGVSLEVLKELMGHRSIQMTLRYTKLYEATKRHQYDQAMARIENRQLRNGGE